MEQNKTFSMRCNAKFLDAIDDWRAKERPILSQSEAIRLLSRRGLACDRYLEPILKNAVKKLIDSGHLSSETDGETYIRLQEVILHSLDSLAKTDHQPPSPTPIQNETAGFDKARETHSEDNASPKRQPNFRKNCHRRS